jgi:hypothetical protein
MPRISPYNIDLTDEERRILEGRARKYTLPYREVFRARIVLLAAQACATTRSPCVSTPAGRWFRCGASVSSSSD